MMRIFMICIAFTIIKAEDDYGYSYQKFTGPVSGELQQIQIKDPQHDGGHRVDFIAKPDYTFSYGVQDPKSGINQERVEQRDGDTVRGQYTVLQADGTTRLVRYTSDPLHGFQAIVEYH